MLPFLTIGKWFVFIKPLLLGGGIISVVLGFHGWIDGKVDKEVAAELIQRTHLQAKQREIEKKQEIEFLKENHARTIEALAQKEQEADKFRYVASKQKEVLESASKESVGLRECLAIELDVGVLRHNTTTPTDGNSN